VIYPIFANGSDLLPETEDSVLLLPGPPLAADEGLLGAPREGTGAGGREGPQNPGPMTPPPRWRQVLPVLLAVQAGLGATALVWGLVRGLTWWRQISLTPQILAALAAGILLSLASNVVFEWLARRRLAHSDWLLNGLMGPLFKGLPFSWALGLSLLSAACEEALFRGVLQAEFGLWSASALFGLLHTGDRRLWLMGLWATAMGLVLGLSWWATGNLAIPVALHAASNLYSFGRLTRWRPEDS